MFLRHFILSGFLGAVGSMPDYWIILNAAGYMEKGVLTVADLEEIQAAIDRNSREQTPNPAGNETETADGGETENVTDGGETENVEDGGETENVEDGGEAEDVPDNSGAAENAGENDPLAEDFETGGEGE